MVQNIYHIQAFFSGRVQGVGFRYTTCQIAKGFEVCGQVKNLPDGRVLLCAEGPQHEVEAFLEEIQSQMEGYIKELELKQEIAPRTLEGFSIIH